MKQVINKNHNSFDLNKIRKQLVQGSSSFERFRGMKDKEIFDEISSEINQSI